MKRGDTMYLFSDGYADQFGGEKRKKFGTAQLKTLLTDLQRNIMHDQKEALVKEFDKWKGQEEQIDDVLMIGIKL
jgi:serine phosphatase RsbU (regulator of sigma subunit)